MLIGNTSDWHGLNLVMEMANIFKEYDFYIYGSNYKGDKSPNVYLKKYSTIEEILAEREYGYALGSLSYFKKYGSIDSNSSLKGVLYHFLDLPFIQSFVESGSPKDFSYVFKVLIRTPKKKLLFSISGKIRI